MSDTMTVTRVHTDDGSRIEPPLGHQWDPLAKLCWLAAVVALDTGLNVRVHDGRTRILEDGEWRPVPGLYDVTIVGHSAGGGGGFDHTWTYLNGISAGGTAVLLKGREK